MEGNKVSSMSRSMRRQMQRDHFRASDEGYQCPDCSKLGRRNYLKRSVVNSRKLHCPVCGWKGRLK